MCPTYTGYTALLYSVCLREAKKSGCGHEVFFLRGLHVFDFRLDSRVIGRPLEVPTPQIDVSRPC